MSRFLSTFIGGASAMALLSSPTNAQSYHQSPAFSDQYLVFSSEDDLWLAQNASTGSYVASRLTSHTETEINPKISPDGNWIAFDASYDGPQEVYLMPVTGGAPKRLTYEGGGVSVRGWTDNGHVLFQTTNLPGTIPRLLRTIDILSGNTKDIPLADADQTTLSDDGKTLFFTRYGLNMFSDNAVMYRGGRMAQLWKYTMGSEAEAVQLAANFGAPIRNPMWSNGRVYFVTDKSGSDNIWSMAADGSDARQHTQSDRWQMRDPYLNHGKIVYQSGADLYEFDIASGATSKLEIHIMSDSDASRDRWLPAPFGFQSQYNASPDGKSVTITSRGHVVTGFTGTRRRVEFDIPETARARSAAPSSDGKWVYAIIDDGRSGKIWRFPADGSGQGEAMTGDLGTYVWALWPSPHDSSLLYTDKRGRLFLMNTDSRATQQLDQTKSSNDWGQDSFVWSSDGRYLAWRGSDSRDISQVLIYDTKTSRKEVVSTGKYESYAPAFSEDGKWLYFVSDRNFSASPGSPWGDRNMGPAFDERGKIYALQLDPEAAFPFAKPDELTIARAKAEEEKKKAEDEAAKKKTASKKKDDASKDDDKGAEITFDGLTSRLFEVPVGAGNYSALAATGSHLYVLTGDRNDRGLKRVEFTPDSPKLDAYTSNVQEVSLSADRKTLFVRKGGTDGNVTLALVPSDKPFPDDLSNQSVRISDWKLEINPKKEWEQMIADAWRLHRDFAFDPKLRDVDWNAVGDHFIPMAERLGSRAETNDLLSQMSAELGILHSQIRQGDQLADDASGQPGFLGAETQPAANGLRITKIYQGETDRPETLGPLSAQGVSLAEGDTIVEIDGRSVKTANDLYKGLEMKAGQQVLLTYLRQGTKKQAIIIPASSRENATLRYRDWVETNKAKVRTAGGDKIGYLHLRAMGSSDVESFARDFYEHFDKDGLIIDVRGNRGGNIDSWIIATLLRKSWAFWGGLEGGPTYANMQQSFRGHLVVLIDEGTYSDGETFSAGVKALDLAPLIGTRTAGAGIWLSDRNRLVDDGQARVAEYAQYGMDGRWLLEGLGVGPDIEIDTPPHAAYLGVDDQLSTALSYLEQKIRDEPVPEMRPGAITPVGTPGQDVK